MKLAFFAIVFLVLAAGEALGDPYLEKNITETTNQTYVVFEQTMDFGLLEKSVEHPLIPESIQIQKEKEKKMEQHNTTQEPKKKKVYHLNFLGVIMMLIFMPFMLMITLFGYLVALCVFCIHEFMFLFFGCVFVFLMILFWKLE